MTRNEEFETVKELIKENHDYANCGLFFTQNTCGDKMETIFNGDYFKVEICYGYSYFEIFGCEEEEREELETLYSEL